jgi:membrane peptidoglycan carboxypeptidase
LNQFRPMRFAASTGVSALADAARIIQLKAVSLRATPFKRLRWPLLFSLLLILPVLISLTSWAEAHVFSYAARRMTFRLAPYPGNFRGEAAPGPYDVRLGYAHLRSSLENLKHAGFGIVAGAQSSALENAAIKIGLPPIYREKSQAGLRIFDDNGRPMYQSITPRRIYRAYSSIPQPIVQGLLFAENRQILDASNPYRNPAVEWDRLGRAVFDVALHTVDRHHAVSGGSTVATQLEKLRHSPGGRTASSADKLRQMLSASLRAFQSGPNDLAARKEVVSDYINSLPLGATSDRGEVTGLADGLDAWFGADMDDVNRLLNLSDTAAAHAGLMREKALAYREALSLLLAARKPTVYLAAGQTALTRRVDRYLRLLAQNGVISARLRDAALDTKLAFRPAQAARAAAPDLAGRKGVDAIRAGLLPLLGSRSLYDLDRLDLAVQTTLDQPATEAVVRKLQSIGHALPATEPKLFGEHLLNSSTDSAVVYSFTLYERGNGANLLRVQADSYKQPLNINEGTKLELGSTAKLRTLADYLGLVTELHSRLAGKTPEELRAMPLDPEDALSAWAVQYLASTPPSIAPTRPVRANRFSPAAACTTS